MSRNKFKIDYSKIKTNRINLNRIDLNDDRYELKKIKKLQENMSLRKLSGNNLDKYLHFTLTDRIGLKISKADDHDQNKKYSLTTTEPKQLQETRLSKMLDKMYGTNKIKNKQYFDQPLTKIKANFNPDYDVNQY